MPAEFRVNGLETDPAKVVEIAPSADDGSAVASVHDYGEKSVFGVTGKFNGSDIVDLIPDREPQRTACAQMLGRKLFEYFVYENPDAQVVYDLGESLKHHDFNIKPFLGANAAILFNGLPLASQGAQFVNANNNQPLTIKDGEAATSDPLAATSALPAVTIGGKAATVYFSGLAPGFVGLWQLNVQVPSDAPSGASVEVIVSFGGRAANRVTIAVE
ncbi:MAG: DUF1800 family protein [Acidobacteriota bacterium]|nr:DUF1800 family protein [Acidobacteriota bacterium]